MRFAYIINAFGGKCGYFSSIQTVLYLSFKFENNNIYTSNNGTILLYETKKSINNFTPYKP